MMDKQQELFKGLSIVERQSIKNRVRIKFHTSGMISALEITDADGNKPIIVAFEDDSIGQIIEQASWHGGSSNIIVLMEDLHKIAVLSLSSTPGSLFSLVHAEHLHLSPESHVGMLVQYALQQDDHSLSVRFNSPHNSDFKHSETIDSKVLIDA